MKCKQGEEAFEKVKEENGKYQQIEQDYLKLHEKEMNYASDMKEEKDWRKIKGYKDQSRHKKQIAELTKVIQKYKEKVKKSNIYIKELEKQLKKRNLEVTKVPTK